MKYVCGLIILIISTTTFAQWTSVNGKARSENFKIQGKHVEFFLPPEKSEKLIVLFELHSFEMPQEAIINMTPPHDSYINVWEINCENLSHEIKQIRFFFNQTAVHTLTTEGDSSVFDTARRKIYKEHGICY